MCFIIPLHFFTINVLLFVLFRNLIFTWLTPSLIPSLIPCLCGLCLLQPFTLSLITLSFYFVTHYLFLVTIVFLLV